VTEMTDILVINEPKSKCAAAVVHKLAEAIINFVLQYAMERARVEER
jgi:hypothetical protein